MNLQSNALKFTKEGGYVKIICEFIAKTSSKSRNVNTEFRNDDDYYDSFDDSDDSKDSKGRNNDSKDKGNKKKQYNLDGVYDSHPEKDKIAVTVVDSGIGIKKDDLKKLFRLFGQASST